jgi:hypothetical protein
MSGTSRRVRFTGPSQRSGPLTMGQSNMLLCMKTDKPAHINVSAVWELPPGTDLDRIAETLAALHARHETLRTTFPAGPGDPEPRQVVHAEGELEIQVCPAPDHDSDAAPFAQELALRLRAIAFDPAADWPVRAAVVTAGGAPTHLALAASHAALDAGALVLLRRDWDALLAAEPLPGPADVQPTDLALLERSDEGRRRSASSLDYWAGQLRTIPQAMLAVPATHAPQAAPGWTPRLRIRSHAAAEALTVLAERTRITRSTLLLTALCALTAHRTGQRHAVVASLSANRYLPELADYFGPLAQDALVTVPVDLDGGETFEGLARRVRKRAQLAYPNSWFDSAELWDLMDRIGLERGTRYARDCVFNDLTRLGLDGGASHGHPDPRDPGQQIQLTRLPDEPMHVELMLWAFQLEGELDASLFANPARLAPRDAEAFGRGLATLLIEAARGSVKLTEIEAITGLAPVVRGPRWLVSDGCWVDLDEVDDLLATVLAGLPLSGPHSFKIVTEPDERQGHRLVCDLTAPDTTAPDAGDPLGQADLERIHAACVAALPRRPAAMAPHLYRVSTGATGTGRPSR